METQQESLSLAALIERDARAGHFLVDILAGTDAQEAVDKHFGRAPSPDPDSSAIHDAEQRGYLKGLNEAAEQRLNAPSLYEQLPPSPNADGVEASASPTTDFFPEMRKSIWDNA